MSYDPRPGDKLESGLRSLRSYVMYGFRLRSVRTFFRCFRCLLTFVSENRSFNYRGNSRRVCRQSCGEGTQSLTVATDRVTVVTRKSIE